MARFSSSTSLRIRFLAALTVAAVAAPSLAHADYWERRARMNDATDLAQSVFGVIGAAAEADRQAKADRCWTEERRIKSANKTVIKKVRVCE